MSGILEVISQERATTRANSERRTALSYFRSQAKHMTEETSVIHELRIYHAVPGRLPDLNKRFETITLKLWEKHGIRQAGFWTVLIGPNNHQLYYLVEWKDMAEREQKWGAFMADPEWLEKRAETERNGPLVQRVENMLLAPTSYSKVK
jgi:hypothetical protein